MVLINEMVCYFYGGSTSVLSEVVATRKLKAASSRQAKADTYPNQPVLTRIPRQVNMLWSLTRAGRHEESAVH